MTVATGLSTAVEPGLPATVVLGLELAVAAALALAVLGVVGSLVPGLPGALFSLSGVGLYWWSTGYADPSVPVLAVLVALGVLTLAVDWLAGAVSARAGGASRTTTVLAAVAGFVLFFLAGPVGVLVGVAGVVFLAEYRRHADPGRALRTAGYAAVGLLASTVAQVLLTAAMFVGLVVVVVA